MDKRAEQQQEAKRTIYEKHGIIEGKNLIVSYDEDNGSIDSQRIAALLEQFDLGW